MFIESFDLRSSNQYILVRMIPSCFRFTKMCLCQVSLLSRCSPRYLNSYFWESCTLLFEPGGGGPVCSCCECDMDRFAFVSFRSPLLKPVLDCK
jgi:hypothetical protein